jgi:hypothetical protein
MNGPIAQAVALTCHANAVLAGNAATPFFPSNSTCQFCDRVTFATRSQSLLGEASVELCADSPDAWFSWLASRSPGRALLRWAPTSTSDRSDRMTAGFVGGGGTWFIEVTGDQNRSNWWVPQWEVWNRSAPNRRIWRVAYTCRRGDAVRGNVAHLAAARAQLAAAVADVHVFASAHDLKGFADAFGRARETLTTGVLHGYHRDLAPAGFLDAAAVMTLDACQSAWVFGGMGSWNDMAFAGADQATYARISEALFLALVAAIQAAVGDSGPSGRTALGA